MDDTWIASWEASHGRADKLKALSNFSKARAAQKI